MSLNIRIDDLFYIYESNNEPVVALRGLHLSVGSGECLVIKGPNGSGKSTLVKLLTGFFTPTAGRIFIGEEDISKIDPLRLRREFVSSIDQRGNLLADITILENIALAYSLVGQTRSSARRSARDLLEAHGFEHLAERYAYQLSAGERQFASLLAAIATNPRVLIADEPSGELDNTSAEIMYTLLRSHADGASVILVTHDPRAEKYASRVVQIREGRVSEEWLPGQDQVSVVDPFGWMRVRDTSPRPPKRNAQKHGLDQRCLLRGENLNLSYGSKTIFSDMDIEGSSGQLIALSSGSGSGKSSLLRILCGIQDPTSGEIYIHGQPLKDLSRERRAQMRREWVGFLGQGGSALANISLVDHFGVLPVEIDAPLESRINRPLSSFSGGERARIELLKILAEEKPILLLDEPTSQMDERRSLEAAQLLLDFVEKGGLVITSTHDEILLENADQIIRAR
jgi:peptide/nickel transport system ATP-binding protein/energy-coupling factor transport system ATP-binding protein